jgi:hypothetical protein
LSCFLHKLINLLFVLQLKILLILFLVLYLLLIFFLLLLSCILLFCILLGRRVVEMREGQSDEIEVELQLSQICGLVVLWVEIAILFDDSKHLLGEKGLLVKGSLADGFFQEGFNLLDVFAETHRLVMFLLYDPIFIFMVTLYIMEGPITVAQTEPECHLSCDSLARFQGILLLPWSQWLQNRTFDLLDA